MIHYSILTENKIPWPLEHGQVDGIYIIHIFSSYIISILERVKLDTMIQIKHGPLKIIYRLVDEAETWLKENNYRNSIYHWNTKKWDEKPADYGKKKIII